MKNANLIDRIYNWVGAVFVLLVLPVNVCYWIGISPLWGLLAPFVLGLIPALHPYWFGRYGYGPGERKRERGGWSLRYDPDQYPNPGDGPEAQRQAGPFL